MTEVMTRIEEVVAQVLGEPINEITDETSPKTVRSWDSMRHIELVMAVEAAYSVGFTPPEVMTINSVGSMRDLLRQKGVAA